MSVQRITAAIYKIPCDSIESDGTFVWDSTTLIVVTIEFDGLTGLGLTYGHAGCFEVICQTLAPIIKKQNLFDIPMLHRNMVDSVRNSGLKGIAAHAISAVDIAIWDLKAKLLKIPLCRLFGMAKETIPVYGSGGFTSYSFEKTSSQFLQWKEKGIKKFKMKVGRYPAEDIERVRHARQAIGPNDDLFVDANGAYTTKQALFFGEKFQNFGVSWFEEPVSSENLEGLSFLRSRMTGMDITAGEYGYNQDDFKELLESRAVDVLQADCTRCLGCVHTRIDFDMYTREGIKKYRRFIHEAADLVINYGGSFSGEHGDGQSRADLLPKMFGDTLIEGFREFKRIWDPEWKMNPGKIIDAYHPTDNMRLGPDYEPKKVQTHFKFPGDDEGRFARATLRCVGVGKCRRNENGVMCPSYMVTKEEKHSTRGRAHLLFEMLKGDVIGKKGWKDEAVKEALDLCLACKGCKSDCPMNVDMATYKAEFLSHYYKGRLRPISAYAFGLIFWWARIATYFPRIVNYFNQTPPFSKIAKWFIAVPQERAMPSFSKENFKHWFFKRGSASGNKQKVILWADTFNNYFHPKIAKEAVAVLDQLGFDVMVPKASLCCGRPLYDYGMLKLAKRLLKNILKELKDDIENGTPIIGLEPSCVSVFRDELQNLFPSDLDAKRLKEHTFLLSEFIQLYAKDYPFKHLNKKAIVQGHCHHKSVLKFDHEKQLLQRLGLDAEILDSGCCGMAGSFGFEKKHYDVSIKAAERVLLPAIRNASKDTLIIANGFSCKEQIEQTTGREVLHLSQVVKMALYKSNS